MNLNETQIEEIVLSKLGIQKRSAFNILGNKELCDRIINEHPMWLDHFSKEYGINKSILQRLVRNNIVSSFSNIKDKGSKIFVFKDEVLGIFKLNYGTNEFFTNVTQAVKLYLIHIKNTITTREYEIIYDVLVNKISIDDLANKYDLTRTRVKQIFDRTNRRLRNSYRISLDYEVQKEEYETLKYEVRILKEKRMALSQAKVFENKKNVIASLPAYNTLKKEIWDFDISVRLLNALRYLGIERMADIVVHDKSHFSKCRNLGVKSLRELENLLIENNLHFGMTVPVPELLHGSENPELITKAIIEEGKRRK